MREIRTSGATRAEGESQFENSSATLPFIRGFVSGKASYASQTGRRNGRRYPLITGPCITQRSPSKRMGCRVLIG